MVVKWMFMTPWVDKEEEKKTYKHGLIEDPFQSNKKYAAIIVAVSHNQFLELTKNDLFFRFYFRREQK